MQQFGWLFVEFIWQMGMNFLFQQVKCYGEVVQCGGWCWWVVWNIDVDWYDFIGIVLDVVQVVEDVVVVVVGVVGDIDFWIWC